MKQDWTPTPWVINERYGKGNISTHIGRSICSTGGYSSNGPGSENVHLENEANARRIVAAVNAASKLSTESLEDDAVEQMIEVLELIATNKVNALTASAAILSKIGRLKQ